MEASGMNNYDITKLLLEYGADPTLKDRSDKDASLLTSLDSIYIYIAFFCCFRLALC